MHSALSIDCSVSFVEIAGLFKESCAPLPITGLLVDLTLQSVELKQSWCVVDSFVHESEGLAEFILEHIVLGQEVVEPELNSRVLLVFVTWPESHLLFHRVARISEESSNDLYLLRVVIELTKVLHH